MRRRGGRIAPRKTVFLGGEGESEQGYGSFLNDLIRAANKPFHIDVVNLNPGAGSPLALLKRAIEKVTRFERQRGSYSYRAVLIDEDTLASVNDRAAVIALAAQNGIEIIWQSPCHEAFLLRHFAGRLNNQPATSQIAINALRQEWPDYQKGSTGVQLSKNIDVEGVKRVAGQHADFAAFLTAIGL
jgi:hypothetical protein